MSVLCGQPVSTGSSNECVVDGRQGSDNTLEQEVGERWVEHEHWAVQIGAEHSTGVRTLGARSQRIADAGNHPAEGLGAGTQARASPMVLESHDACHAGKRAGNDGLTDSAAG